MNCNSMRRRKLLISIGALGAGGTAAFGTEAFTSVEAERSVDVKVASDENAFLAIEELSQSGNGAYVSTESDNTLTLNFDENAKTQGGTGVNKDAVTTIDNLFDIINQGTQKRAVFIDDESDDVTFRVTSSNDEQGTNGNSLESSSESVDLDTGQEVVVGVEIDTRDGFINEKTATIRAEK